MRRLLSSLAAVSLLTVQQAQAQLAVPAAA